MKSLMFGMFVALLMTACSEAPKSAAPADAKVSTGAPVNSVAMPLDSNGAKAAAPAATAVTMYECPMKCEKPTDKPGKCGKCKMDLKAIAQK
jgi:zona occludens toxin (predicted ATPase)